MINFKFSIFLFILYNRLAQCLYDRVVPDQSYYMEFQLYLFFIFYFLFFINLFFSSLYWSTLSFWVHVARVKKLKFQFLSLIRPYRSILKKKDSQYSLSLLISIEIFFKLSWYIRRFHCAIPFTGEVNRGRSKLHRSLKKVTRCSLIGYEIVNSCNTKVYQLPIVNLLWYKD